LDPFKGGLRTLKAFNEIMDEYPDFRLTLAGDGKEAPEIHDFIEKRDLSSRVEFIQKQLSRSEMRTLFHESSFLVFPSEFESFGLVAAEAMATGLPVLIADRTGPRDYSTSINSVTCDPLDLVNPMRTILSRRNTFSPSGIRESILIPFGTTAISKRLGESYISEIENY
jgi:glycosyltransferase involved in cell wall biosynthesis